MGILTDGRSLTQRNKIAALGLEAWINDIVISEEFGSAKPDERNYRHFEQRFPTAQYVYVGNDVAKDFIAPNRLGWLTVCVRDNGGHIHPQDTSRLAECALPNSWIERLA
jgi:putative hydrolase of the HAD superfamily